MPCQILNLTHTLPFSDGDISRFYMEKHACGLLSVIRCKYQNLCFQLKGCDLVTTESFLNIYCIPLLSMCFMTIKSLWKTDEAALKVPMFNQSGYDKLSLRFFCRHITYSMSKYKPIPVTVGCATKPLIRKCSTNSF